PQLEDLRGHAEDALASATDDDTTGFMTADRVFHEHLLEFGLGRRAAEISLRLRDQSRVFAARQDAAVVDAESARQLIDLVDLIESGRTGEARELVVDNLHYFKRAEARETCRRIELRHPRLTSRAVDVRVQHRVRVDFGVVVLPGHELDGLLARLYRREGLEERTAGGFLDEAHGDEGDHGEEHDVER